MASIKTEQLMLAEIRKLEKKYGLQVAAFADQKPDASGNHNAYLCFMPSEVMPPSRVFVRKPKPRGKMN